MEPTPNRGATEASGGDGQGEEQAAANAFPAKTGVLYRRTQVRGRAWQGEREEVEMGEAGVVSADGWPGHDGLQQLHSDVWSPHPVIFRWEPPQPPCLCYRSGALAGEAEEDRVIALRVSELAYLIHGRTQPCAAHQPYGDRTLTS